VKQIIAMLDERLRSGSKAVEDDICRHQIGSGKRGVKRRAYRYHDGIVPDHVTGKSIKAGRPLKCGVTSLWLAAS
jgi:protein subunit release factor A